MPKNDITSFFESKPQSATLLKISLKKNKKFKDWLVKFAFKSF